MSRCLAGLLPLLSGCGAEPTGPAGADAVSFALLDLPDAPVDECALPCLTVQAPAGTRLALLAGEDRVLAQAATGADHTAQLCPVSGRVSPLDVLSVEQVDTGERLPVPLDIRPFGWDMGRDRVAGAPATLRYPDPWVPPEGPFFTQPEPGEGWCDAHITSPHLAEGGLLLFSGKGQGTDGAYRLGALWLTDDGPALVEAPLLSPAPGDWDRSGQVSPTSLYSPETGYTVWFHGKAGTDDEEEVGAIGRATSEDGVRWVEDAANPVLGNGEAVKYTHPAVLMGEDGVVELWHLSDGGALQFALSADGGASFVPWCGDGLPMEGKSPEVLWDGDRYLMTWSTGQPYDAKILYGESYDGIRWTFADHPALRTTEAGWHPRDISNGQLVWVEGALRMLYLGVWDVDAEGRITSSGFGLAAPGG